MAITYKRHEDGTETWTNEVGRYHRIGKPALVFEGDGPEGSLAIYYIDGVNFGPCEKKEEKDKYWIACYEGGYITKERLFMELL